MTLQSLNPPQRPLGRGNLARVVMNTWLLAVLLVLIAVVYSQSPQLLDPGNINTVLRSFSIMVVMVLGLTWVMAAGKIDVSFMQIAALANMSFAWSLDQGYGMTIGVIAGLGVGVLTGLINGWLVCYLRLPALIVTIATAGICASVAAALGKGTVIRITDTGFLGALLQTTLGPVPIVVFGVLILCAIAWYMQERLALGRYIYAIAQNEAAVQAVGVPVKRLVLTLFVLSGATASVAGLLLAANLSSGQPMIGGPYLINGLTVVLLGGMMIHIGKPNILGTLTATLFLGVLFSAAALLGLPDYQRQIIQGVLLALGLIVATTANRRLGADRR